MIKIDKRVFLHFDYVLPLLILPLIYMSYFLVSELHPSLASKQLVYFSIGFIIFIFFFLMPIKNILWITPVFYWFNIILLILVKFFGTTKLGAQRWLEVPGTNFTIQPSELMKPALILMLLYLIKKHRPSNEKLYNLREFAKIAIYIVIPFVLILKQPDLGTSLMLLAIGFGILFVIGVDIKIWLSIAVIVIFTTPLIYSKLQPYQKKRINDFMNKPSYHVQQSIIAIGSGGKYGREKSEATQSHLKFLPIATSDFIFSFFVERFGFVGGVTLISLYFLITFHLFMMVIFSTGEYLIQVTATGLALLFFIHSGVNIAMNVGYAPVVGLPLPILSYGGTSFLTIMMIIGIYENLVSFRHDDFYDSIRYAD
jgi:rod shape determining protein RodA